MPLDVNTLPPPPTPLQGLGVTLALIGTLIGWFIVGGTLIPEPELFGALMILWYWAKIERLAPRRLRSVTFGALLGVGIAWFMLASSIKFGSFGVALGLAVLLVAIYLDIIEIFPSVCNGATMLFSIVAASPLVQLNVNWIYLCYSIVGGSLYFSGLLWVADHFAKLLRTRGR